MKTYEKQQEWTSSPLSVLGSSARSFSRGSANKAALIGLGLLIVYAALRGLLGAMSKAFWHDELCTWIMAHQPSLAALWKALQNAADGNPPGFYLIERAVAQFVPNEEIAFRLPSLLGFCCVLLCLFVFIRRRSSDLVAVAFFQCPRRPLCKGGYRCRHHSRKPLSYLWPGTNSKEELGALRRSGSPSWDGWRGSRNSRMPRIG